MIFKGVDHMGKIADALRKLAETPDDLTKLPEIIAQVSTVEESEIALMSKVDLLHEANKRYLKMVTVSTPEEPKEPEPEPLPTLEELAKIMSMKEVD